MKLIKIGSSPSVCDIVLNSPYVSAHHADITLLDNGDILIEDKGSSNGTFVGAQKTKLEPGREVPIHRGDRVTLANVDLPWNRVPQLTRQQHAERIINIGSHVRNDIVVPGGSVSRYHAQLIINKKKAFIVDNHSTNGTSVNGVKIIAERLTPVKIGDNVIVGGEDITDLIEGYLPPRPNYLTALKVVASLVALCVLGYIAYILIPRPTPGADAVVLVRNVYQYNLELADNPFKLPIHMSTRPYAITGTGFFIDEEGRIGTNRHVACPWLEEYQDEDAYTRLKIQDALTQEWSKYLEKTIPAEVKNVQDIEQLASTELGNAIVEASLSLNTGNPLKSLNQILQRLYTTPVKITGQSLTISIAYANRHYTDYSEFELASMVAESGDISQDVAILQLNTKVTPQRVMKKGIFDINKAHIKSPGIQKEDLQFSGYPEGLARTWDEHFNVSNMMPTTYRGKCIKNNDPYKFEIQAHINHGASGSPVYCNGVLYGILWGGFDGGNDVIVAPARQLKNLYDEKVLPYKQ